jgi:hypothetical protein
MATTRSFNAMLNDYLPNSLLKEEMIKRDWLLSNVELDEGWQGASSVTGEAAYIVPFVGAGASSVEFGALADVGDIAQDSFVRGRIDTQKEVWGSMVFNHRDLMEHGKNVTEKTFLKILPDRVEAFMQYMKEVVSVNLIGPSYFASMTAETDLANGVCEVDRIDRFVLGQKVALYDNTPNSGNFYVIAIDVNAGASKLGTVTLSASRGGSAANISAYTVSQSARFYHPGAQAAGFQTLIDALLSAANGGSSTLHGKTKLLYPFLQAVNVLGSDITAANILEKLFDAYNKVRMKAKGNANTILMSFKHLGSIMKLIETQKGGFKVTPTSSKASQYGWTEIEITSVKGALKIVGIQEMPDAQIVFLDPKALVFASNGMFRKRKSPDGTEYYESRATAGYSYIVDVCLFGDLVVKAPGHCGIIYSISY